MLCVAAGADYLAMPKNMAVKLAKDSNYKAVYIQIHYNNPEGVADAKDSSGFTAYATSKPREHEYAPLWPHIPVRTCELCMPFFDCFLLYCRCMKHIFHVCNTAGVAMSWCSG